jgi:hypothetical protein
MYKNEYYFTILLVLIIGFLIGRSYEQVKKFFKNKF